MTSSFDTSRPRILLLTTQVFSRNGGIPAYMRRLLDIFSEYAGFESSTCGCISLAPGTSTGEVPPEHLPGLDIKGCDSKLKFVATAIGAGLQYRPALVVTGHVGLAPVGALLKLAGLARHHAIILHGTEAWERRGFADRLAARFADVIVSTTTYTAQKFAQTNSIPNTRQAILPLGLGETSLPGTNHSRRDDSPFTLLTVGRLEASEKYKGVDTLIHAISNLSKTGENVELKVVGVGDDRERLRSMAAELRVSDRVHWLGGVSDEELQQLYAACDVFAMPSRGEGFGIVFLEAMRHGKPCVGGNHGGTPEVVEHGKTGLLVNHGDVESLCHQIKLLAHSADLRRIMGAAGREAVRDRYLFSAFRKRWLEFLDSMLSTEFHKTSVSGSLAPKSTAV